MAQKTIDFENDILRPIGSLKRGLADLDDNKITKFYTNNNGDTVLNDSDDGKIQDLMIYGKSEQKQYKGINLLPPDTRYGEYIEVSIPKNSTVFWITDGIVASGGNFRLYNEDKTEDVWFQIDSGTTSLKKLLTIDVKYVQNLVERDFDISKICLGVGSEPIYEPYTGGKPSPSPEYPQEIKAVVNPVIKTHGVNILDIKDVEEKVDNKSGLTYSVQNGTLKVKGTSKKSTKITVPFFRGIHKKLVANNTYIFNPNPTKNKETSACYLDFTNNVTYGISTITKNIDKPITLEERYALYEFELRVMVQENSPIDMEWKPQLLLSNILLPYQPYQESQATLPYELYAIPVSSGGNVTIDGQQYIADYVDIEKGVLVRNINHVTLKGITAYELTGSNYLFFFDISTHANKDINNGYCRYYIANGVLEDKHVRFDRARVYIRDDSITNKSEFDSKYKNGLEFAYVLSVPVETGITEEEIEAFKALSTYYPKTYINAESEQLNAYTMFNYPVSMEKGWEYVKQQIGDTRKYVYDMDLQSAEAYVNSEYAVALTELEV